MLANQPTNGSEPDQTELEEQGESIDRYDGEHTTEGTVEEMLANLKNGAGKVSDDE